MKTPVFFIECRMQSAELRSDKFKKFIPSHQGESHRLLQGLC